MSAKRDAVRCGVCIIPADVSYTRFALLTTVSLKNYSFMTGELKKTKVTYLEEHIYTTQRIRRICIEFFHAIAYFECGENSNKVCTQLQTIPSSKLGLTSSRNSQNFVVVLVTSHSHRVHEAMLQQRILESIRKLASDNSQVADSNGSKELDKQLHFTIHFHARNYKSRNADMITLQAFSIQLWSVSN